MRHRRLLRPAPIIAAACVLAGCLPSSRRGTTDTLLPSDSLSRAVAAGVPVDTLHRVWRSGGPPMELPTSIAWTASGVLVVADTRAGTLRFLDSRSGQPAGLRLSRSMSFPYLAGALGDSVAVHLRGEDQLIWLVVHRDEVSPGEARPLPAGATAALATRRGVWLKRADEHEAWLVRLDGRLRVRARHPLNGPSWRRIGFLRPWGDSILSLSGYRPVVDIVGSRSPNGAPPDTLALVGFDSPQLLRSHRYIRGEVDQPPLLTSSAAADDDDLFAINLRTDQVRVDVFDRAGRLRHALVHVLESGDPHFPVDLAVRRDSAGVLLALVMQSPGGLMSDPGGYVLMLRWAGAR